MIDDLGVKFLHFLPDNRGKGIPDPAIENLISRSDDPHLFMYKRFQIQDRAAAGNAKSAFFGLPHPFLLNHQGDDTGACQPVSPFYGKIPVAGGNHHLAETVDRF